jgi:hypothetical protein
MHPRLTAVIIGITKPVQMRSDAVETATSDTFFYELNLE